MPPRHANVVIRHGRTAPSRGHRGCHAHVAGTRVAVLGAAHRAGIHESHANRSRDAMGRGCGQRRSCRPRCSPAVFAYLPAEVVAAVLLANRACSRSAPRARGREWGRRCPPPPMRTSSRNGSARNQARVAPAVCAIVHAKLFSCDCASCTDLFILVSSAVLVAEAHGGIVVATHPRNSALSKQRHHLVGPRSVAHEVTEMVGDVYAVLVDRCQHRSSAGSRRGRRRGGRGALCHGFVARTNALMTLPDTSSSKSSERPADSSSDCDASRS